MKRILLDIDGVCADWTGAVQKLMGKEDVVLDPWPNPGDDEIDDALGVTDDEVWEAIDALGAKWWANLKPYPWFLDLFHMCREHSQCIYLTTPGHDPNSLAGKLEWMKRWHGEKFRDYLIGPQKQFCAHPDSVLIDDRESNTKKFEAWGGNVILFPMPWNRNRDLARTGEQKLEYVRSQLTALGVISA
jgi:5'(3')-deoxyribonucleotidase